ncbi:hypothetical protein QBC35DRAFT_476936 [Podospora australis]|uniref:Zn(2)-C6 fungal-type domain-containing protein n=1 Tax=Podospora australis TaxID=1536484 RepID=A0AAN6WNX7_9PEZI|nr:hypothetical protein QBC35DRAFT_476936 [Podospora australis]
MSSNKDIAATAAATSSYDTAEVAEILKGKRKARDVKACFPCRHRKIKCDGKQPCSSCVYRDHPDLCRTISKPGGQSSRSTPENLSGDVIVVGGGSASPGEVVGQTQGARENSLEGHYVQLPPARDLLARADSMMKGLEGELELTRGAGLRRPDGGLDVDAVIRRVELMEEQLAALKSELMPPSRE